MTEPGESHAGGEIAALVDLLYPDLHARAHRLLALERLDHTLSTTALVHEAYLRFQGQRITGFSSREQFMAAAGVVMRRVLVDYARARGAGKRGGGLRAVTLDEGVAVTETGADTVLQLEGALAWLESASPRLARVVECRFYGGMTDDETATALGVTSRTVRRDWVKAKGLLYDAMERGVSG
jgi:RNA polymerase sigma factor (TIGR02999 family)